MRMMKQRKKDRWTDRLQEIFQVFQLFQVLVSFYCDCSKENIPLQKHSLWCSYLTVTFATAASQNGVCITQQLNVSYTVKILLHDCSIIR